MPTPAPITPITAADALNTGVAVVQMLGLMGVIAFFAVFVPAAALLWRRFKGGSR